MQRISHPPMCPRRETVWKEGRCDRARRKCRRARRWWDYSGVLLTVFLLANRQPTTSAEMVLINLPDLPNYRPNISDKEPIILGYLTGSQQLGGDIYYQKPGQAISGAITKAVDEINNNNATLPNHVLQFVIAETYGSESYSIRHTAQLPSYNISAYIGPQETCVHEGRIAASFNLPMISYHCAVYAVSDKHLYPTFTRTKPHDSRISMSVVSLLHKYNWRKVAFIYSSKLSEVAKTLYETLRAHKVNVTEQREYEGPYFHDQVQNPFARIVSETYQRTRIYVMLGAYYEFVGLMVALYLRGLLDTGEFFVVGVDCAEHDPNDPQRHLEGLFEGPSDNDVITSFRSFMGIAPAPPVFPAFDDFSREVNRYLESPPFNFHNPYAEYRRYKKLRAEAAFLYDAVWLYARAAHKAIQNEDSPSNGTLISDLIKGTTYKSAMGYTMRIDENGDAEGNFTLLGRRRDANGAWGIMPIGTFILNRALQPTVIEYNGSGIDWVGGAPPVDEPECGFFGEKCIPGPNYTPQILGGVLGGLVFIVTIIGGLLYRNWLYEQALASLLWKIDYRELELRPHASQYNPYYCTSHSLNRVGGGLRSSMISLSSQVELDLRQVFTQVGTYKKSIIAVKRVRKKYVDLTRNVRKELKLIRDIRHDNLNMFIGACVDPGNICIVTEYCSRGSLQDILANDDLKLDDMFIASLIFDIIKGMSYLHDSAIRTHGRLKSSNCVVDSRWVLKLTDYGLVEFKAGAESDVTEHTHYQSLLWTAPELLRDPEMPPMGSQKGDVYSFAIILYELHGRNGPYGDMDLSPKEIIQNVIRRDGDVCFRPKLAALGAVRKYITECIKECWNENPMLRPDFKTIRNILKPMQKGMKPNIFDNMMAIMERHATNLEELVDEKTDQLREEKKKTEELLHQMLPSLVAEQLKQGKQVEAETFEMVTIYFSDICGFTALSSESSPMQVVDLLNDLYTVFDSTIEHYDVYKVETIGDAYMVVSGLPNRNGIRHAGEITSMSLHLLSAIQRFKVRHRPNDQLKLRIGIHSGSCVAGVVGLKMPRYCLFGDTVNTASRMESNGQPLKIHCSNSCKQLLDQLGGYSLEDRGLVYMKGKGEMRTYWVSGEDRQYRISRLKPPKTTKSPRLQDRESSVEKTTPTSKHTQFKIHSCSELSEIDNSSLKGSDKALNGLAVPVSPFLNGDTFFPRRGSGDSSYLRRKGSEDIQGSHFPRIHHHFSIHFSDDNVKSMSSLDDHKRFKPDFLPKNRVGAADCVVSVEEKSPLLRFGSARERKQKNFPRLQRSATDETPV